MNLNENPRLENLEISDDPALCGFLVDVVDTIYKEHAPGDFGTDVPTLFAMENVELPGRITAREIEGLKPPTTGKIG
ncbi:hypothetical protein Pan216_30290 [Planctomycetes bacterium Pan216]|uniref:Uncharacterized protein n=1 Tax=Kolteria novifilia TaxID=2527975 RepID=A0A518B5D4_9BACT|nr:hypothetical protein Pan216_30290 [Planctomycetes bacterium Pan216]